VVLATGVFALVRFPLSEAEFTAWGWRIPFLLSIVLVVFGMVVRARLGESPQFTAAREKHEVSRAPIADVLRHMPGALLLSAGLAVIVAGLGNVMLVYILTYATTVVGIPASTMLGVTTLAALAWAAIIPVAAQWAERVGRRRVLLLGVAGCSVWGFPYFWMIDTGALPLIVLATLGAALVSGLAAGPHAAFVSEAFPVRMRYTGVSVGYAIGAVAGGALTPLVATALFTATGSAYAIAAYLLSVGVLSVVCTALLRSPVPEGL
jgi:MFS family permease